MTSKIPESLIKIKSKIPITAKSLFALLKEEGLLCLDPKNLPSKEWHADTICNVQVNEKKQFAFQITKFHRHPEYTLKNGWGYGPISGIYIGEQLIGLCSEGREGLLPVIAHELNADPKAPLYIVWERVDPSINGFYEEEAYKRVYCIARQDKAMKFWEMAVRSRRSSGSGDTSYSYPQLLKESEMTLKEGDKVILRQARKLSHEELSEIEQGF